MGFAQSGMVGPSSRAMLTSVNMTDAHILLTALIAVMHVPIWGEGFDDEIQLTCSCGWNTKSHSTTTMGFFQGQEDLATDAWLRHQQGSERLTRAAIDLATADAP